MARLETLLESCGRRAGAEALSAALIDALSGALSDALADRMRGARVLRGMVHLRPGGAYAGLIVHPPSADAALTASATAWRHVEATGGPVLLDVKRGELRTPGATPTLTGPAAPVEAFRSQAALLLRAVTHLVALPLRDAHGAMVGMAAVELNALGAVGRGLPWEPALPELEALCQLAGPWLAAASLTAAAPPEQTDPLLPVVGAKMAGLMGLLRVFAAQDETVLISGPTGAGKSRLARWCHARSARAKGPFEAVDLLTIPDEMQQGELFGWRRGAFTGAARDHDGAVTRAEGGTLFLDEIDKLSLRAQAGLLQLLEERRYRPLGASGAAQSADVRFLVGTNADLRASVAEGRFREDLYYRINVLPVRLPPLGERTDEIPGWASFMVARRETEAGTGRSPRIEPAAAARLASLPWPGNLRQLDNTVRRAWLVALSEGGGGPLVITPRHVERALLLEQGPGRRSPLHALQEAAAALAAAAADALERGAPLDLGLTAAFEGLVLEAAERLTGSRDGAFLAFGRDAMVEARNHHKAWRRAAGRVRELCEALGVAVPPAFSAKDTDD